MTAALGRQKGRSEELWYGAARSRNGHGSTPDVGPSVLARFLWIPKQVGGRARRSEQRNSSRQNECRMVIVIENYPGETIKMWPRRALVYHVTEPLQAESSCDTPSNMVD